MWLFEHLVHSLLCLLGLGAAARKFSKLLPERCSGPGSSGLCPCGALKPSGRQKLGQRKRRSNPCAKAAFKTTALAMHPAVLEQGVVVRSIL